MAHESCPTDDVARERLLAAEIAERAALTRARARATVKLQARVRRALRRAVHAGRLRRLRPFWQILAKARGPPELPCPPDGSPE